MSDTNNPCTSACNLVACADNANNLNDKVNSISSRGLVKDSESLFDFNQWFVGFSDAEGSFWILPVLNSSNGIKKITFVFSIELHKDDLRVLEYIQGKLKIGNIRLTGDKCVFTVTNMEGTSVLISIFDKYNLNSTKYLDYVDYKTAFYLYQTRDKNLLKSSKVLSEELASKLLELKNGMNTKRTNTIMPVGHEIVITKIWLLGYIEGDASFFISRTDLDPTFSISASEEQLPLFYKIKEFLENSLGFDKYSLFKLNTTKTIAISKVGAREKGKPSIILLIKNIRVLNNYFIPFFNNIFFISKKGLDFEDFKIICSAVFKGSHKNSEIRCLLLKLSYNMNNYRLSTFKGSVALLSNEERDKIINVIPLIEYLKDGRVRDINKNVIISSQMSCLYEVTKSNGDILILDSLKEVLTVVDVNFRVLKKQLDLDGQPAEVKGGYIVKRIPVFQPFASFAFGD